MISWPPVEPVLVDSKLLLRPWAPEDAPEVFDVCQDPLIQEFTTVPVPYTREISELFVTSRAASYLNRDVIALAGIRNGELVLSVSLHSIHEFDHVGEIGYWVKSTARGEGLAALAVQMITDFAFGIGFRRITAITLPENKASQKTLLKAGFEMETLLRQGMTKRDGSQTDAVLFAKFPTVKVTGN
jgi:RimJ/RimL family protein N-acetyltransferase